MKQQRKKESIVKKKLVKRKCSQYRKYEKTVANSYIEGKKMNSKSKIKIKKK